MVVIIVKFNGFKNFLLYIHNNFTIIFNKNVFRNKFIEMFYTEYFLIIVFIFNMYCYKIYNQYFF
ncbi:hypothetical protein XW81_00590 [Buchnera aphidicola (Schlechtendalia chinensis)]|uniref:Uncharacterized protein n=1 Tax=Buchnera aphidicola subsp. Schlechtendalia chinensis TaxID=118110 RepID=A0A172WD86_BUCSC|nr:hypothetical protein XW81_00590 [Buchnera aphidicola (Schlechtendalia chinensis)]